MKRCNPRTLSTKNFFARIIFCGRVRQAEGLPRSKTQGGSVFLVGLTREILEN